MINMKKLLALLVMAVLEVSAYAAQFPDISVNEVNKLAESKAAVIIDVNGDESFKAGGGDQGGGELGSLLRQER